MVLLFLLCAFCVNACAAGLLPCGKAIRFTAAWFEDPELDNSKSSGEITTIGASVRSKGTQIGHVVVQTRLAVLPQESCAGWVVRLDFVKPVLRVAKEMAPGSCAYARVLNHEQTHVRIYRDIARDFRELDFPWPERASNASVLAYARLQLDRLMLAQAQFDSAEEYAKNQTVCGGEILRLVEPTAPARSIQKPG